MERLKYPKSLDWYVNSCVGCYKYHNDPNNYERYWDYYFCSCSCISNDHEKCKNSEICCPTTICYYCSQKRNCCQICTQQFKTLKCQHCDTIFDTFDYNINHCYLCHSYKIVCHKCVNDNDKLDICIKLYLDLDYCSVHKNDHLKECDDCKAYYDLIS